MPGGSAVLVLWPGVGLPSRRSTPLNTSAAFQALPLLEPTANGRSCGGVGERPQQPRQRDHHVHRRAGQQLRRAPPPRAGEAEGGEQHQARQRHQRLRQLHVEGQPQRGRAEQQPGAAPRPRRLRHAQQREHRQRHHHPVHRVAARGDHLDRQQRQHERGGEARGDAPDAPHGEEQQRHRRRAEQRLGEQQARRRVAERLHARDLQPEVHRRLVDRHAPAGLQRAEEEVVPGVGHAPDGGVVEGVQRRAARGRSAAARPPAA